MRGNLTTTLQWIIGVKYLNLPDPTLLTTDFVKAVIGTIFR